MRLQGDLKAMAAAINTFWPPFLTLEVALRTTNRNSMTIWSNLYLEILMALDVQCGSREKPKRTRSPTTIHFALPSQCWKRLSTLPMLVYGVGLTCFGLMLVLQDI